MRVINEGEYFYRLCNAQRKNKAYTELQRVAADVRSDLRSKPDALDSDKKIGEKLGISPVTVYKFLRNTLSEDDFQLRAYTLTIKGKGIPQTYTLEEFVREETEAYMRGEINSLESPSELASLFGISEEMALKLLLKARGKLTDQQNAARDFYFSNRIMPNLTLEAMREVAVIIIKESLIKTSSIPSKSKKNTDGSHYYRVSYKGLNFDSAEEGACALTMEEFIEGFELKEGETFQVRIGSKRIDFLIGDTFVEYHPIQAFWRRNGEGDFKSLREYLRFKETKEGSTIPKDKIRLFIEEVKSRLEKQYFEERRRVIDSDLAHRDKELIVATTPEELYYLVIKRFSKDPPSKKLFEEVFNRYKAMLLN
ncbi:MAG: hypothetical protein D6808_04660 [Candidatus Dadabacteria bacterium]|nr:MAG: hypothetical protein D6808_04660 [Candidatus Dadabacteria bacterium]